MTYFLDCGLCHSKLHKHFMTMQPCPINHFISWWRYQMETSSALLALCEENPPVPGGFPSPRAVALFTLICAWTNGWANNRDTGDLRRHHARYDVTVMCLDKFPEALYWQRLSEIKTWISHHMKVCVEFDNMTMPQNLSQSLLIKETMDFTSSSVTKGNCTLTSQTNMYWFI